MPRSLMNQKLRILVLKHLADCPRAGYGLIKDIHEHTGWKPSYGSIYPLLDRLKREGLVEGEANGKKKVYHLTKEGKEATKALKLDNKEAMATMERLHRLVMHLCGVKQEKLPVDEMVARLASPDQDVKRIMQKSYDMKLEFARLLHSDAYKRHNRRIIELMDGLTATLKKMK